MSITLMPTSCQAVILGLLVGIYWLCVLWLVARTKRQVGRAANIVPPEPLGRILRFIWIPAVLLWIFLPMLAPFVLGLPAPLVPLTFPGSTIAAWIAVAVAVIAFAITVVCWIKMGTSWRMGIDPNEKTKLVFNGPFAYVRNPIYGLSQLMVLASLCTFPCPLMFVVAVVHMVLMQWEVRREEKYLLALHGTPYADYMQRVGRFVPRIGSWK